jgi:hypothetical protein
MRAYGGVLIAALLLSGCGSSDPQPVCDGDNAVHCDEPGYFPLCSEPEPNAAVDDAEGLYCAYSDRGLQYIGPELDRAPACEGGDVVACPDGAQPACYFLPNCLDSTLP